MADTFVSQIKLVVVGDSGVGKTCLLSTFVDGGFPEFIPTVYGSYSDEHDIGEGKIVRIDLWDTATGAEFDKIRPLSYRDADVFLICFDILDRDSFVHIGRWYLEIQLSKYGPYTLPSNARFLIIGCKRDLRDNLICKSSEDADKLIHGYLRECDQDLHALRDIFGIIESYIQDGNYQDFIDDEEAQKLSNKIGGYKYLSCSSLKLDGVTDVFHEAARCAVYPEVSQSQSTSACPCSLL